MTTPLYHFLRVLEYVGPREELDIAIERRQVKGTAPFNWNAGKVRIHEAIVGEVPTKLPITQEMIEKINFWAEYETDDSWHQGRVSLAQELKELLP